MQRFFEFCCLWLTNKYLRLSLNNINILVELLIIINLGFIDGKNLIKLSLKIIDLLILCSEDLFFFLFNPLFFLFKVCGNIFSLHLKLLFNFFFLFLEGRSLFFVSFLKGKRLILDHLFC